MRKNYVVSAVISILFFIPQVHAEQLDNRTKKSTINSIINLLSNNYVYPNVAGAMNKHIKKKFAEGRYAEVNDSTAFADVLTEDLRAISKDKHLRVK
jgi:hypothetical protein